MKQVFGILILGFAFMFLGISVNAATFIVNTTDDAADATPSDGICATAPSVCSLRAAISEANALAGAE